jgi:hypothetical protein
MSNELDNVRPENDDQRDRIQSIQEKLAVSFSEIAPDDALLSPGISTARQHREELQQKIDQLPENPRARALAFTTPERSTSAVINSPLQEVGTFQQLIPTWNFNLWGQQQEENGGPSDLVENIEAAEATVELAFKQSVSEELLGQDRITDATNITKAVSRVISKSKRLASNEETREVAAAVLVDAKQRLDDIALRTDAQQTVEKNAQVLVEELDRQDPTVVRRGFADGFSDFTTPGSFSSSTSIRRSPAPTPRPQSARTPPPSVEVDSVSHPHVSTAAAQHDDRQQAASAAAAAPPPPVPARPLNAAVQNLVAQQVQQQMAAIAPAAAPVARRIGSLNQGAPDQDTAENIGIVLQNLEDAPLVAGRLSQGLLKTEDVLDEDYVTEMEVVLRKRKATKEVVGRDVRYRTARAAYRPPVNVTTTATPGVYKYQRPRFARPMIG